MTAVVLAMLSVLVVAVLALGWAAATRGRRRPAAGPAAVGATAVEASYDASFLGGFAGEPDAASAREGQDRHVSR